MSQVTYLNPPGTAPAQGLYSHVGLIAAGRLAMIAGQLSVGADGAIVGRGDFAAQFRQVFANLGDVLKGLGGDFSSVARFTTYLVDAEDIARFMTLRAELFPGLFAGELFPPNTLLVVARLVRQEFLLEVEAIASI